MNINILDLTLICTTVIFATIMTILLLIKNKQKNIILRAFQKSIDSLKSQITNDEAILKNTLGSKSTSELEKKIAEIIAVEKDAYSNLLNLFVDYHPAAIEMMPVFMSKITASYVQYIDQMLGQNGTFQSENNPREQMIEGDPAADEYQYEALIEQLRFEKQDFADKYKNAHKLLEAIYLTYKDKLELTGPDTLANMNLTEIATLFATEQTVTTS